MLHAYVCSLQFVELSGGLNGGSEPPAFQHAEMARLAQDPPQKVGQSIPLFENFYKSSQQDGEPCPKGSLHKTSR